MSKNYYIIPIFVPHEGCPHNCVFCNQNSITGSRNIVDDEFVEKTISEYLETIEERKNHNTIIEVSFFGGTFTAIPEEKQNELLNVAMKYKIDGKIDYIRLSTRPDYINEHILDNLKEHLVDIIELGVQSLDEEVLKMSGRGHSANDVIKASKLINDYGFILGHQIMLGLPGDSIEKDIETVKKSIKLGPKIYRIYPALVIKNTPMEKMVVEKEYNPYSLSKAVHTSKIIYSLLINANINVIRIGLQPTEEINTDADIIAGPFHPSFRELVEGSLFNDMIYYNIKNFSNREIDLFINKKDISKLYTNKKEYFFEMMSKLDDINVNVIQSDDIIRGTIGIRTDNLYNISSLREYTSEVLK